ncbi:MAG TPA: ATP-binding protein [Solirubrobacteraceae bacterium]|nr:ATP-binding protein [Solirubrobacteraceae bacterium]
MALVIVAQSEYLHWTRLNHLSEAVKTLSRKLNGHGYRLALPRLLEGGNYRVVMKDLPAWLEGLPEGARLVIYWSGHGQRNKQNHYLALHDSPRPPRELKAVAARTLATLIAECAAEKVLVLLDTCYSGAGAAQMAAEVRAALGEEMQRPGQVRCISVYPSAHALQQAQAGAFCRALTGVLFDEVEPRRKWSDRDRLIMAGALNDALTERLQDELGSAWQPGSPSVEGSGQEFIPNPRYGGDFPASEVDLPDEPAPRAPTVAFFTGRDRALEHLRRWRAAGGGVIAVTGPPGAGKSAVLREFQSRSEQSGEGVDATVQARGASALGLAHEIGSQLETPHLDDPIQTPSRLVDYARRHGGEFTVLVDGLDEAQEPLEVAGLLRTLTDAGARVAVGTRYNPQGGAPSAADPHRRLLSLFGGNAEVLDLAEDERAGADIGRYIERRLLDDPESRHRNASSAEVKQAGERVAERAGGLFLYARLVAPALMDADDLASVDLPDGFVTAFLSDIEARVPDQAPRAHAMLAPLAWAEGVGLSRAVWPTIATTLSAGDRYDDEDVVWTLATLGPHLLEDGEEGQQVFRLGHQSLVDHYRRLAINPFEIQRTIAAALLAETA